MAGGSVGTIDKVKRDNQKSGENANKARDLQKAEYDALVAERPEYSSGRYQDGGMKWQYRSDPMASNLSGLSLKMREAKDISKQDVKSANVETGHNFDEAQKNISQLNSRAFGTGPSAWASARNQMADANTASARNQMAVDTSRATAQAQNSLAMQGGIDPGTRARLARQGAKDRIRGSANVTGQGLRDKMQISADDEAQRLQLQQQMPGMNLQADSYRSGLQADNANRDLQGQQFNSQMNYNTQAANQDLAMKKAGAWGTMADSESGRQQQNQQFNATNAIQDNQGGNAYAQQNWQTRMGIYGANRTADAQARAANQSGGLLSSIFG